MRQPPKALEMAPGHFPAIRAEEKIITIRTDHRDFKEGDKIIIYCKSPYRVMEALVTGVIHTTLNQVPQKDYLDDGFTSRKDLLAGMKRYYPDIKGDSPVTIIRWRLGWD